MAVLPRFNLVCSDFETFDERPVSGQVRIRPWLTSAVTASDDDSTVLAPENIDAQLVNGVLFDGDGNQYVELVCDSALLGLTSTLQYFVSFRNLRDDVGNRVRGVRSWTFNAPTSTADLSLNSTVPVPGSPGMGTTSGSPGAPVDDVQQTGDTVQFYVQGNPVGDPVDLPAGTGGGLANVVEDTTPQLGGNLDLNSKTVGDASAADLTKLHGVTASAAELNVLHGIPGGLTATELGYVDGVTSSIQTQLTGKAAASHTHTLSDIAAASVVTEAEGIPSNDNDTTVPTSAAVKDYVDDAVAAVETVGVTDGDKGDITVSSSGAVWTVDSLSADKLFDGSTNKAYTEAEKSKLAGIVAGADVTNATTVNNAGAVMNADTSTLPMGFVIDEDTMVSNRADKVPTQQSVKAYVDAHGGGGGDSSFQDAVEDHSADNTGVTDTTAALQAALDAAATSKGLVWLPAGSYKITDTLVVPTGVSVAGPGAAQCVITTDQAIVMMTVGSYPSGAGDRYGMVSGFALDGNDTATGGLDLVKVVVQRSFRSLEARNIAGFGYRLDATQNCTFADCDANECDKGWLVLNDAGSNLWLRCETADSHVTGLVFDDDNTLGGYSLAAFGHQGPSQNRFIKCLYEYGSMTKGMDIVKGRYNAWEDCNFTNYGSTSLTIQVNFQANALANKLIDCSFNGNSAHVSGYSAFQYAVKNAGYRNYLIRPTFEFQSMTSADYVVSTSDSLLVQHPQLSQAYKFEFTGGGNALKGVCIIPLPSQLVGPTASRPDFGPSTSPFGPYMDTDLARPVWWNGTAWIDPIGSGGGGGISDGDKGDITVSSTGTVWTIDNNTITNAKMADGAVGVAELSAGGTPDGTTFLRGDNTWATPAGGGSGISNVVDDSTPQLGGNLDLNGNTVGDASAADLTKLHALAASATELNYVDGVTSAIQTQLDGKIPGSRTVSAGTGLTGGGDLSANRTFAVSYGSSSGPACQGNDSRLTDARTPTDGTVTTAKFAAAA
jgi:hypothetical protein